VKIAFFLGAITFDTLVIEGSTVVFFFFFERYWTTLVLRIDKSQKSSLVFLPGTFLVNLSKRTFF
jgi:hypothetical protein